jgi:PhzF family phenazine biosynthesis protein
VTGSTAFYLVDVFTDRPFTGNPLAIVTDADDFDTARMQRVAGEFNQTETTFLLRPTAGPRCSEWVTTPSALGGGSPPRDA